MGSRGIFNGSALLCFVLFQTIKGRDDYNPVTLDDFIRERAQNNSLTWQHTGTLYGVSLPSNFSGMEVSMVRLRSESFWARGANFSFFHISPRIVPMPFVKWLDIVYSNLTNLSNYYYSVLNHTLITPVIGFRAYVAMNSSEKGNFTISLSILGDPITPQTSTPQGEKETKRRVAFCSNVTIELSDLTMESTCIARNQWHFALAVLAPRATEGKKTREELWKWWVIGYGLGAIGLLLTGSLVFGLVHLARSKMTGRMEKQSEKNEPLNTTWVGSNRMPSASGIRTQPVLENDYFP